jgi:DnaJ-class molecular chaperone
MNYKYLELDQEMTDRIMAEFKGQVMEIICPHCKGNGHHDAERTKQCEDCQGKGHYWVEL